MSRWVLTLALAALASTGCKQKTTECPETLVIRVPYPGATPQEVEWGIVLAIEEAVAQLDGVGSVDSRADEGGAVVGVTLDSKANADAVLLKTREALSRVTSFPQDAEAPMAYRAHYRTFAPVLLHADVSSGDLRGLAESFAREVESSLNLSVEIEAPAKPEVEILAPAEGLRRFGITRAAITTAVSRATRPSTPLPSTPLHELGDTVIARTPDGASIRLADVAEIRIQTPESPAARLGGRAVALLTVSGRDLSPLHRVAERLGIKVTIGKFPRTGGCGPAPSGGTPISGIAIRAASGREAIAAATLVAGEASDEVLTVVGHSLLSSQPPLEGSLELWSFGKPTWNRGAGEGIAITTLSPRDHELVVELSGGDPDTLRHAAAKAEALLRKQAGLDEIVRSPQLGKPELSIRLNREHAAELGVSQSDVAQQVRSTLVGVTVPWRRADAHAIRLRFSREPPEMKDIMIETPTGEVPLSRVADVEMSGASAPIHRIDQRRVITLTCLAASANALRDTEQFVKDNLSKRLAGVSVRTRR